MHCYSATLLKQQSAYRRSSNRQIMPTQSWPVIVLESWTLMMCAQRRSSRNHVLDWSEILDLIHDISHSMRPKTQNFIYIMERKFKVMFYNTTTINQANDNISPQLLEHKNNTISDVGNPCSSIGQAHKCGLYYDVHVAYVNETLSLPIRLKTEIYKLNRFLRWHLVMSKYELK